MSALYFIATVRPRSQLSYENVHQQLSVYLCVCLSITSHFYTLEPLQHFAHTLSLDAKSQPPALISHMVTMQNTFLDTAPTDFALKSSKSVHSISKVIHRSVPLPIFLPDWL